MSLVFGLFRAEGDARHPWGKPGEKTGMVYGTEKPPTRRSRAVTMAIVWVIPGIPIIIGLWLFGGWWALLPLAVVAWASIDYIRKGGSGIDQFRAGF